MSHLIYVHAHINYLLFSSCLPLDISLIIYVRIHNLTATLKIRIDIDRIDSNSNFAQIIFDYQSLQKAHLNSIIDKKYFIN